MDTLVLTSDWLALLVQIALFAQISIVCLIVLIDLPSSSFISSFGRMTVLLAWLTIISNLFIEYPEPLHTGLCVFAAFLLLTHSIKCLLVKKACPENAPLPLKSYVNVFIFGLLHKEHWPNQHKEKSGKLPI